MFLDANSDLFEKIGEEAAQIVLADLIDAKKTDIEKEEE